MEDEGHVALDFIFEQRLAGLDALPGGGDLDEDAIGADACLFVEGDQSFGSLDCFIFVEGQPCIHLRGHESLDLLEDLHTERDTQVVVDQINKLLSLLL